MLLVFMYHRARAGRHGNAADVLDAHFAQIASRFSNVLPGDSLRPGAVNVCLSFDDATFDFYAVVFPLLWKHRLRALLAVVPSVVRETVNATGDARLSMETESAFADPDAGGFCTWRELEKMAGSGHVQIASHGLTHRRLDDTHVDLASEVEASQTVLASRLGQPVGSFVFPFGRFSRRALQHVRQKYAYAFRIGGALNRSWKSRVLYRIDGDAMPTPSALFSPSRLTSYRARYFWNRVRFR